MVKLTYVAYRYLKGIIVFLSLIIYYQSSKVFQFWPLSCALPIRIVSHRLVLT